MATYNGATYIPEQIESIVNQSYTDWELYIQDDGSTDNTLNVINGFTQQHANIHFLGQTKGLGAKENFFSMLQQVDSPYYMFCDQDDVWLPNKVETEFQQMVLAENDATDKPILVFSDLYVVDSQLNILYDSFFSFEGIYPEFLTTFNDASASNLVTGCTMLFNRAAKNAIQYPTRSATMHDVWITLCVMKANGLLKCISSPLVYYRQHGSNTLGANSIKRLTLVYRLKHIRQNYLLNLQHHNMLKALGYGSWLKFIYYRLRYKIRVRSML